jgi:hypothetical protein
MRDRLDFHFKWKLTLKVCLATLLTAILFIRSYPLLFPLTCSFSAFSAGFAEQKIAASRAIWGFREGLPVVPYVLPRTADWDMGLLGHWVGFFLFQIRVSSTTFTTLHR